MSGLLLIGIFGKKTDKRFNFTETLICVILSSGLYEFLLWEQIGRRFARFSVAYTAFFLLTIAMVPGLLYIKRYIFSIKQAFLWSCLIPYFASVLAYTCSSIYFYLATDLYKASSLLDGFVLFVPYVWAQCWWLTFFFLSSLGVVTLFEKATTNKRFRQS